MDKQTLDLLLQASHEIKTLRQQNQLQSARLEMFDNMMLLFKTEPAFPRMGASEDLVWKIEKAIAADKEQQPNNINV